jgi:hypothetical protein
MKRLLIPLLLLAGCGTGESGDNATGAQDARKSAVQTAELTGLYEGGPAQLRNQLCVIDRGTGNARFGLVVWGENQHSCSGSGTVVREGSTLRLQMAGDEECRIEGTIDNGNVTLPQQIPEGCNYYCGARARMAEVTFEKTGGTAEDAMRAADLVGEPLCAGI